MVVPPLKNHELEQCLIVVWDVDCQIVVSIYFL